MSTELELNKEDFEETRYSRLELIPWWNQELLHNSTVMVVGAGAIGNELIKNLALLGVAKSLLLIWIRLSKQTLHALFFID